MSRERRYCVFRIVNEARKEIFLVSTSKPIFEAISEMHRSRPPAIRDWDFLDIAKFESLEFHLTKEQADDIVRTRVANGHRRGYRYILDVEGH